MPLSKCPRCQALWNRTSESLVCDTCAPDEESDREKVLDCIGANPGMNADEISKETDVSNDTIRRMLDAGVISREIDLDIPKCGQCGAPAISHSQLVCNKCLSELDQQTMERRRDLRNAIEQSRNSVASTSGNAEDSLNTRELLNEKRS